MKAEVLNRLPRNWWDAPSDAAISNVEVAKLYELLERHSTWKFNDSFNKCYTRTIVASREGREFVMNNHYVSMQVNLHTRERRMRVVFTARDGRTWTTSDVVKIRFYQASYYGKLTIGVEFTTLNSKYSVIGC